jgi:hypothetical protein
MRKFFTWPRRLANHQPDNFTPAPESGEWHEMFKKIPPASRRRGRPGSHTPFSLLSFLWLTQKWILGRISNDRYAIMCSINHTYFLTKAQNGALSLNHPFPILEI